MSNCIPTVTARTEFINAVEARGNRIAYGNPVTLQLDIDGGTTPFGHALDMIRKFRTHLNITGATWKVSKTPGHKHVYVNLGTAMAREDRIFWQVVLGSDPVREALNMLWIHGLNEGECFLEDVNGPFHEITIK